MQCSVVRPLLRRPGLINGLLGGVAAGRTPVAALAAAGGSSSTAGRWVGRLRAGVAGGLRPASTGGRVLRRVPGEKNAPPWPRAPRRARRRSPQ